MRDRGDDGINRQRHDDAFRAIARDVAGRRFEQMDAVGKRFNLVLQLAGSCTVEDGLVVDLKSKFHSRLGRDIDAGPIQARDVIRVASACIVRLKNVRRAQWRRDGV